MLDQIGLVVLSYYEQHYWENGNYPTFLKALDYFKEKANGDLKALNVTKLKNLTASQSFKTACKARGIPFPSDFKATTGLTPEQILAANLVMSLHDRRSLNQKLKLVNVTPQEYDAWLRDPTFVEYIRKETDRRFELLDLDAKTAIAKNIQDGDLNSIKYYMEITGRYRPSEEVTFNFMLLVSRMMEILARHLSPDVLEAVAVEMETVLPAPVGLKELP